VLKIGCLQASCWLFNIAIIVSKDIFGQMAVEDTLNSVSEKIAYQNSKLQ
jgi:hypothetical protein